VEKKPQVPPLRFAPVGMTILTPGQVFRWSSCGQYRIVISTGRILSLWLTQADENQFPFSIYSPRKHRPPLVIPTGAQRSGGTCGFFFYLGHSRKV
jgi:hypothetical protein